MSEQIAGQGVISAVNTACESRPQRKPYTRAERWRLLRWHLACAWAHLRGIVRG